MANTPVSGTAVSVVYTPSPAGVPHCVLYGQGQWPVWLGGSAVSTVTGLKVLPGGRVEFPADGSPVYAVAGFAAVSPAGTVVTAAAAQAGTILTTAAGGTFFTTGMVIAIDAGSPRQELAQVNGSNAGTVFTNAPLTYSHAVGAVFSQVRDSYAGLVTTPGVGAT